MQRIACCVAACLVSALVSADDTPLLDFSAPDAAAAWTQAKHINAPADLSVTGVDFFIDVDPATGQKRLSLAFGYDAGWSAVGTTRLAVEGNWREFKTLKLDLTVEKPLVAYVRVLQGKPDEKGNQPYWEHTMILQPGKNEMVLLLHGGVGAMDPKNGNVTGFLIGAFRPEKPQGLRVESVRLSTDWPWTRVVGWYSPYCHDGYSAAAQRDAAKGLAFPRLKVLGTDLEVTDLDELSKKLKDKWVEPAPKTAAEAESDFRARFDELKKTHPKAQLAVFREGDKGFDPADPEKVYSGWKMVYINCHGPDGPNAGRENTPALYETVEAFMRHRSPLMQADLSSIPKGAAVLAAEFVVNRSGTPGAKTSDRTPFKPNTWACEMCNRDWDPKTANCYFYAAGKPWKAVSGLYYGDDPDYWPLLVAHAPAGTGQANLFDFTEAVKLWVGGTHPNHGFFFYGDSVDYMSVFTTKAKDIKLRPAIFVAYDLP